MHIALTLVASMLLVQDKKVEDIVLEWQRSESGPADKTSFYATVSVVDGDTLKIQDVDGGGPAGLKGYRVRLCGIDTMEFRDSKGRDAARAFEEPLAEDAREELKWIMGVHRGTGTTRVKLIIGPRIRGGYNRLLAWPRVSFAGNEVDPAVVLLERGLAVVWRYGGNADDPGYLWEAQLRAMPEPGQVPTPGTVWSTVKHMKDSDEWTPAEHQFLHRFLRQMRDEGFKSCTGYDQEQKTSADRCKNKAAEKDLLRNVTEELESVRRSKKPPVAKGNK